MPSYQYSHLRKRDGADAIRLLRLLPNEDENARIECQLFDYFLPTSDKGAHLYEALSYVWGSPHKDHPIVLDNRPYVVTANLHAALSHLRNRHIERVIWIDAICINQEDLKERGYQIQCMAKIFGKAKCVIVWLGETAVGSDRAIEKIGLAADNNLAMPSTTTELRDDILKLLERPWFRRIWVLQEAAAARQILISCGATQIDGHTFCVGLKRLNLPCEGFEQLQSLIRPVFFLISQAIFRPKSASWWSGRTSLEINTLAELIDMYHTHEAAERHDMVFALLGMSSDDLTGAGLSPNYDVPWAKVFMNLLLFVFGKTLPIATLGNGDLVVFKVRGHIIGEVSSVKRNISWSDRQEVDAIFWNEATKSRDRVQLTFRVSAKPILERDLICLFEHLPEPMIIRACKDYFGIIKIAALPHKADLAPDGDYSTDASHRMNGYVNWTESVNLIKTPPREFLLVWDWKMYEGAFQHQEYRDLESKWCGIQTGSTTKAERLSHAALILAECEDFVQAKERIQEAIDFCEGAVGKDHPSTLSCMDALGLMCKSNGQLDEAEAALILVIQARIRVQGASHLNTLSSMNSFKDLASVYERAGKGREARRIEAILEVLKRKQGDKLTEKDVIYFAGSLDEKAMLFLLETRGHEFKITEGILKAAVGNDRKEAVNVTNLLLDKRKEEIKITEQVLKAAVGNIYGAGIIRHFLEERGGEFKITEGVVTAAAGNPDESVMELLLRRRGDEFKITEAVVKAAAGNLMREVMCALLEERGDEVKITEAVMIAAAKNPLGYSMMGQLLGSRGNEITITEEILIAAAENDYGDHILHLLVDRRGSEPQITPQLLNAAARSRSGDITIRGLLEERGDKVNITEEIVKAAVGNEKRGKEILKLLLDWRRDEVEVTEEVLRAASAVQPSIHGAEIMSLLLDRLEDAATIPNEVLRAIPKCWDSQEKISKYIQNERESWGRKREGEGEGEERNSTGKKQRYNTSVQRCLRTQWANKNFPSLQ